MGHNINGLGWMFNGAANIFNGWRQRKFQKAENEKQQQFQLKLEEKRLVSQQRIADINYERQLKMKEDDKAFQIALTYQAMEERRQLALLNAMLSRETAVNNIIASEDVKNFPLRTSANDILVSFANLPYRPLKIVLIPPEFPKVPIFEAADKFIIEEVGKKIHSYYGNSYLVEYLGDNWLAQYKGEAAIRKIFNQLNKEPMLIADLKITREYLSLIVYYWNIGHDSYQKELIIDNFPIMPVINYYKLKSEHKEVQKYDVDDTLSALSNLATIIVSMIADIHLYINGINESPILLQYLPELISKIPASENVNLKDSLVQWVVKNYKDTMENMQNVYLQIEESDGRIENQPFEDSIININTFLDLASFMYQIEQIKEADFYLKEAIENWCRFHNIKLSEVHELIYSKKLFNICSVNYDEYFFSKLASLYLNNHTIKTNFAIVGNLINAWSDEKRKYLP